MNFRCKIATRHRYPRKMTEKDLFRLALRDCRRDLETHQLAYGITTYRHYRGVKPAIVPANEHWHWDADTGGYDVIRHTTKEQYIPLTEYPSLIGGPSSVPGLKRHKCNLAATLVSNAIAWLAR